LRKRGLKKKLNHSIGKALHDWDMIVGNDRILVGVSGGKDSLALLHFLASFKKKAPISFEIIPVHIDPGFERGVASGLKAYIDGLSRGEYRNMYVEYTDYGTRAHSGQLRENPCFTCSRLRRKRFFELAGEHQCTKIALGHNKDDLIETLFMNIFYAGKIGTMKPRQSFFDGTLDIIRPLSYVEENDLVRFSRMMDMPKFINPCPSAGETKRGEIRKMLEEMYRQNKHIKGNVFRAMGNIARDYLLEKQS